MYGIPYKVCEPRRPAQAAGGTAGPCGAASNALKIFAPRRTRTKPFAPVRLLAYCGCMARTNMDIDDEACAEVMRRYQLATKREAVNFALRELAAEPLSIEEAKRMRGSGWDGDLDEMRRGRLPRP